MLVSSEALVSQRLTGLITYCWLGRRAAAASGDGTRRDAQQLEEKTVVPAEHSPVFLPTAVSLPGTLQQNFTTRVSPVLHFTFPMRRQCNKRVRAPDLTCSLYPHLTGSLKVMTGDLLYLMEVY